MRLLEKEPLIVEVKRTWLERLSRSRPKTIACLRCTFCILRFLDRLRRYVQSITTQMIEAPLHVPKLFDKTYHQSVLESHDEEEDTDSPCLLLHQALQGGTPFLS